MLRSGRGSSTGRSDGRTSRELPRSASTPRPCTASGRGLAAAAGGPSGAEGGTSRGRAPGACARSRRRRTAALLAPPVPGPPCRHACNGKPPVPLCIPRVVPGAPAHPTPPFRPAVLTWGRVLGRLAATGGTVPPGGWPSAPRRRGRARSSPGAGWWRPASQAAHSIPAAWASRRAGSRRAVGTDGRGPRATRAGVGAYRPRGCRRTDRSNRACARRGSSGPRMRRAQCLGGGLAREWRHQVAAVVGGRAGSQADEHGGHWRTWSPRDAFRDQTDAGVERGGRRTARTCESPRCTATCRPDMGRSGRGKQS